MKKGRPPADDNGSDDDLWKWAARKPDPPPEPKKPKKPEPKPPKFVVLPDFSAVHFSGSDLEPFDDPRLRLQIKRVFLAAFGKWRTLREIEAITGDPPASISAQLRNLRKEPLFYEVVKQRRGHKKKGLWEYLLLPPRNDKGFQVA
jgi:hypothetical protein